MKSKRILAVICAIMALLAICALASCGKKPTDDSGCSHKFGEGEIIFDPTCDKEGVKRFTCSKCGGTKEEAIPAEGHDLGEWTLYREPTPYEEGEERARCKKCTYYDTRSIEKLELGTYITVDDGSGSLIYVKVAEDGSYTLADPDKVGYSFAGWIDADGNIFPASGKINGDVTVKAKWELDGTDTLAELIERAAAGVDEIKITANITISEPVFFIGNTKLYSDGDFSLKRDPKYAGDLFVIGQNKDGVGSPLLFVDTIVTLGGGKGTLTLDGNRAGTKVDVVGSALFVTDSAVVNINDGIVISNNKKVGNDRIYSCLGFVSETNMERMGGAAILLVNGTVNMYGGIIEKNLVITEHTTVTDDQGVESLLEIAGCGGAIYNRGNFNMYGGIIRESEALRGGAIYNDEIVNLVSGTISGNKSHTYGGAVSSSSSAEAQMFIGSEGESEDKMVFEGNISLRAGGGLYSNTNSPIVIYGNVSFVNNMAEESSGGAIYTGGALTVRNAEFIGNSCRYSGGAIYHHYANADRERRDLELTSCTFKGNEASLGGAIMLSAADAEVGKGTKATLTDCVFTENKAIFSEFGAGNGGAIYVTRNSDAFITGTVFEKNEATTNAGAVAIHSEASVRIKECGFNENKAGYGGALYTASKSEVSIIDASFTGNKAILDAEGNGGNGGAIFTRDVSITIKNTRIEGNSAENNGGGIYQVALTLELDGEVSFKNNSASKHGGAIYISYSNLEDGSKKGATLKINATKFENNTALSGGAISARSESKLTVIGASFTGNTTPGAEVGTEFGGGAVYANNSTLSFTDTVFDGNSSGYYGGVFRLDTCVTAITGGEISGNAGGTGGAIYAAGGEITLSKIDLKNNTSALNGVIYVTRNTLKISELSAEGNSGVNGGVLYVSSSASAEIVSSTFKTNNASYGGVIYTDGGTVTVGEGNSFAQNTAKKGGAIEAINGATLTVTKTTFENNSSSSNGGAICIEGAKLTVAADTVFNGNRSDAMGGAIYVTSHFYTPKAPETPTEDPEGNPEGAPEGGEAVEPEKPEEPEEIEVKATVSIIGASFKNGSALRGGAIYVTSNGYLVENSEFIGNCALDLEYGGGAIYNTKAAGTLKNVSFEGNTSHKGGAVALHTTSTMVIESITAKANAAVANSAGKLGVGGVFYLNNSTLSISAGENGKAVIGGSGDEANTAVNGGAICADNGAVVVLVSSELSGNAATNYGGAVYAHGGSKIELENVKLVANIAANHGGAIYSNASEIIVGGEETAFERNTATNHGGAIYLTYTSSDDTVLGSVLTVIGGSFTSNSAMGGGAVSIRSSCEASFENTVFTGNSVKGYADENDGDGEGGGAIYVGYGKLVISGVTMTENIAEGGFGGAINALNCTEFTVCGGNFTDNSADLGGAIAIRKKNVNIGGDIVAKDNGSSNIYLYDGALINVVDELGESAMIGVTLEKEQREFARAGGDIITELESYRDRFFSDGGDMIYLTDDGKLALGLMILEQPDAFNKYTVSAVGDVSYAWHLWVDGVIGSPVEGANGAQLTGAVEGATYVCVVSFGDKAINTEPTLYMSERSHPICGEICECEGKTHENITWTPIVGLEELRRAMEIGGSYYLAFDIAVDKAVSVKADAILCLNGKKLTKVGDADSSIINVAVGTTLTLTDCGKEERVGYIDPESGLWCEGVYEGEGEAIEYVLYGGVITGGNATYGGAVYVRGTLELYNVNIAGNMATNNGGAIYLNGGTINAYGDTYFVGNTATNHAGAVYVTYVKDGPGGVMDMTGGAFAYNKAMGGGAISIRTGCEATFTGTIFLYNSVAGDNGDLDGDAEGGGAIYVGYATLNLNSVTMMGNVAEVYGGAINSVDSDLTVIGGEFKNNTAIRGGAVNMLRSSQASFTSTKFISNAAIGKGNTEGGGAINAESGSLTISGVTMDGNRSAYYGGAINARMTKVVIKDNTVITGSVGSTGAALYFREAGTNVTITDTTVSGNKADANGVIYMTNTGTLTVSGLTAVGNEAYQGGIFYVSGGAIITLDGVTAEGNEASFGGAVYVSGAVVTVSDSTFEGNSAKLGSAVYVATGSIELGHGVIVKGNTATDGGAVYVGDKGTVTVIDAVFTANSATKGGAIFAVSNAGVAVKGAEFRQNSAKYGGAIYVEGTTLYVGSDEQGTKTLFEGNVATELGGAIYINKYSFTPEATESVPEPETVTVDATVTVDGARFDGNTASQGGAIYVAKSEYAVGNAEFVNNSASGQTYGGGAIYSTESSGILASVTFTGNASHKGGAVALHSGSEITVMSMTATGNSATLNDAGSLGVGGAFFVNNSTLKLVASGSNIIALRNNSAVDGGAIYAENCSVVIVNNVVFEGNSASNYGGAIDIIRSEITVNGENTLFKNNSAASHGGAMYLSYVTIEDVKEGAVLNMTDGRFEGNTAFVGGAVSARTGCQVSFTGTEFIGNSATAKQADGQGGGAIYANNNVVILSGVTMDGNSAGYYGGAIATNGCELTIKDDCVIKNSVGSTGVAIDLRGTSSTATITNLTLTDNIGNGSGVIYVTNTVTLNVSGLTASGNKANNGGVFYISGSAIVSVDSSAIFSNIANASGGAIDHRSSGKLTVKNTVFTSNESGIFGGAVTANGTGKVEIIDCTFDSNKATAAKTDTSDTSVSKISRGGGAIFVSNKADVTVSGSCSFISNSAAGNKDVTTSGSEMTDAGGAIMVDGGKLTVIGATFKENQALNGNGGAIGTSRNTSTAMNIKSCSFIGNVAYNNGGAIYIQNGVENNNIVIDGCSFTNNTSTNKTGSAVYVRTSSSATITNVTCSGGTDSYGDAFYFTGGAKVVLGGTVSVSGDKFYATGSGTTITVNYKTAEEKMAWQGVITTVSSAKISYVDASGDQ